MAKKHDVRSLKLAEEGRRRIEWAEQSMDVLRTVRERFAEEKPFAGVTVGACAHVTAETANLIRTFTAGGAKVFLCASNPLSTQDSVAAALVKFEAVPTYAVHGADLELYSKHVKAVLGQRPRILIDDGAVLLSLLHADDPAAAENVCVSLEETASGVRRLRAMERDGVLRVPVVAVNDAASKRPFENRYGTGQSTLDGIVRATGILLAGRTVVVAGFGWCGKGVAARARGMGAQVIVTEIEPIRALEATMEGYRVMPMRDGSRLGDVFVTLSGSVHVLREEHFQSMRDGAIVCNAGHSDAEIDLATLQRLAKRVDRAVRDHVDAYRLANGRSILVLAGGRPVNLTAGEGQPASVLDMSFATQALTAEWALEQAGVGKLGKQRKQHKQRQLGVAVHAVPASVENQIAVLKLASMGIKIDRLTSEQREYMSSWSRGA